MEKKIGTSDYGIRLEAIEIGQNPSKRINQHLSKSYTKKYLYKNVRQMLYIFLLFTCKKSVFCVIIQYV